MADLFTVDLVGHSVAIEAKSLYESLSVVDKMIKSVSSQSPLETLITSISGGSIHITCSAEPQAISTIRGGLTSLRTTPTLPDGWTESTLEKLIDLHKIMQKTHLKTMSFTIDQVVQRIDDSLAENAEKAKKSFPKSLGMIRGVIYRYLNDDGNRSASVKEYKSGQSVKVRFSTDQAASIRENIDREVRISGVVKRNPYTKDPLEIIAEKIYSLGHQKISSDDVAGIYGSDWCGDFDTVDWVRSIRG